MINKNPSSVYKIRFNDCDLFGHLNNSRYLDYLINAREDHLKDYYDFDLNHYYKNNLAWVVNNHEIAYLRPAVFNEKVSIQTTLLKLENSAIYFEARMLNEKETHLKAIMRTRLIPINTKTGAREEHQPDFMEWATTLVDGEANQTENLQLRIESLLTDLKKQ